MLTPEHTSTTPITPKPKEVPVSVVTETQPHADQPATVDQTLTQSPEQPNPTTQSVPEDAVLTQEIIHPMGGKSKRKPAGKKTERPRNEATLAKNRRRQENLNIAYGLVVPGKGRKKFIRNPKKNH